MTDVMKWEKDKYYSFKTGLCISKPGIKIISKKSHNLAPDFSSKNSMFNSQSLDSSIIFQPRGQMNDLAWPHIWSTGLHRQQDADLLDVG